MENFFSARDDLENDLPLAQKRTLGTGAGPEEIFTGTPSMPCDIRKKQ